MFATRVVALLLTAGLCLPLAAQEAAPEPKQRIRTARDLAKEGSSALPKLQAMLADPDADVRVEAVKSMVDIGTQASLEPLMAATRDNDGEVQIRATDGLVNFYLPGYVRTGLSASLHRVGGMFKAKFTDTNNQVVDYFVAVRPEVITALGKLARSGNGMEARGNAARAIGILRGKAALPDLYEALRSKDDVVIFESLIAIQKIRDPDAASHIAFLLRDLDDRVQVAAIETTGLLRNREALPDLRNVLGDPRNKKIRRATLTAIAMIPDESSRPVYTKFIADKDDQLRAAAAEGFARLKNPADLAMIEKRFNEERKMSPRLSLAFAAVALGKTEVAPLSPLQYLINQLNSVSWRGIARPFLVELGRERAVRKSLEEALGNGTRDEKIELARVLSISGDKDTVPYLDKLSHDADTDVAKEAIDASRSLKVRLQ